MIPTGFPGDTWLPVASHFETDQALAQWVSANGLPHVTRLGADVLLPHLGPAERHRLGQVLNRHRLTDFATRQSLQRFGYALAFAPAMRDQLPPAAWTFLEAERGAIDRARSELSSRLEPPDDPAVLPLHRALQTLRATFPGSVPPRLELSLETLQFQPSLPGFRYQHDRRWVPETRVGYGLITPSVELRLSTVRAQASCSCGGDRCLHALAAIDTALLWLRKPPSADTAAALQQLSQAPWQRTLKALATVLDDAARARDAVRVSWRVQVLAKYGVEVHPYLHRVGKRGLSSGTRLSPSRLLEQMRSALSAADLRLAEVCEGSSGPASQRVLLAMVDHPLLFLDEAPDVPVKVERLVVGLVAEDRNGAVVLSPGVDGTPLDHELRRAAESTLGHPLYLWEEGSRRLSVLDVSDELRGVLGVLTEFGDEFPPESYGPLVEKLAVVSARLPVAMPRSVMGEAVVPRAETTLRLQLCSDRSVRVELRARPIPEGMTFTPGEGPRDAYARRGHEAFHAVRNFEAELSSARAMLARLPLSDADPQSEFEHIFPDPRGALALLSAHRTLEDPKPPLEWMGEPLRLVASAAPTALKVTLERRRDWFGALGGLSVEGERVELAVLLDAARRKERFVQVHGQSYVEIEEALLRHLARLSDHTYASKHGVEFGPSAAEALDALAESGASVSSDQAWRSLVERIFAARNSKPRVPASLKATLRDYQLEGFQWLTRLAAWGAGAVLADDMGLGKTVQALAALLDRAKLGPALVLAPTSVGFIWLDEAARFAPSLKLTLYADSPDRGAALATLGPRDVLVLSYGLLTRDLERLKAIRFSTIVFDEAQALKNAGTHRARAARDLQGDFKIALSGTPMENHLGELWSLYRIVFPGLLGSWDAFRSRFANPIEKKLDPTAGPALARVLQPFLLRRTKGQVETELPPRTEIRVPVVLSAEEWKLYEDARLATLSELETRSSKLKEQERRVQILAALTRLRLLSSHPRLYDASSAVESSKLQRLMELVDELSAEGHRALVFSQFTSHLALVREVLDARGIRYVYLDGSTAQGERRRRVEEFQNGDAPLFLISLKAGGFGLNLTSADNVIHLDPWWNPAVEDQASDRAHRIGQTKPVTVYRLISKGTIEEQILGLHVDKRALVSSLLEGKEHAGRLSTQELLALLTDRAVPIEAPQTRH